MSASKAFLAAMAERRRTGQKCSGCGRYQSVDKQDGTFYTHGPGKGGEMICPGSRRAAPRATGKRGSE